MVQLAHKVPTLSYQHSDMGKKRFRLLCCVQSHCTYTMQLLGAALLAIGIYVQVETAFEMLELTSLLTNPAIVMIVLGSVLFILGFCGCLGALLEIFFLLVIVMSYQNNCGICELISML